MPSCKLNLGLSCLPTRLREPTTSLCLPCRSQRRESVPHAGSRECGTASCAVITGREVIRNCKFCDVLEQYGTENGPFCRRAVFGAVLYGTEKVTKGVRTTWSNGTGTGACRRLSSRATAILRASLLAEMQAFKRIPSLSICRVCL